MIFVFAGPTLMRARAVEPGVDALLAESAAVVAPPVRRGDLPALVRRVRGPAALAIVDGVFHTALSVGHAEIRALLGAGWQVWGLSSMGAIRAREMHHLGMRGFGRVFAEYCVPGRDFRDDEVTLLHEPEPPYREASEPLVHLRGLVRQAAEEGVLATAAAAALVRELEAMWFGDRTLAWVRQRLGELSGGRFDDVARLCAAIDAHRVKAWDLVAFLRERPWRAIQGGG